MQCRCLQRAGLPVFIKEQVELSFNFLIHHEFALKSLKFRFHQIN